jgi:hypothetical protein
MCLFHFVRFVISLVGDIDVLEDFILSSKSKHENNEVFIILELNFLAVNYSAHRRYYLAVN